MSVGFRARMIGLARKVGVAMLLRNELSKPKTDGSTAEIHLAPGGQVGEQPGKVQTVVGLPGRGAHP